VQEPLPADVAQICATCAAETASLPSVPVPSPDPPPVLVVPPVVPAVVAVTAGVETDTDGFTDADELAVLPSIPASEAAAPLPLALADVPGPLLLAVASPSANALVEATPVAGSTEPSELASMCAKADAEPSPTDVADTSTLAEEDAEAVPSRPVLVAEPAVSAAAVPVIAPPPAVETSMSASAADAEEAEVSVADVVVSPSANAWPWASPSPLVEPVRLAEAVVPSSVAELALAEPDAEPPAPEDSRSTPAVTAPSAPTVAAFSPSPVDASAVPVSLPVASAWVDTEESAELPAEAPAAWAPALPLADAEAPAPSAVASECEDELAEPPPAVAWLSDVALVDAALADIDFSHPVSILGAIGAADSISAKALVESARPSLKRRELRISFSSNKVV
jgi:hypothetical protein